MGDEYTQKFSRLRIGDRVDYYPISRTGYSRGTIADLEAEFVKVVETGKWIHVSNIRGF